MDSQPISADNTITVQASKPHPSHFWAGNGFSFHDLLDTINPLQHLPLVGTLYRHFTGDKIGNVAEVVGDGLYGGLLGLASGVLNVAVKEATGKDIGENLIALVEGHDDKPADAPADTPAPAPPPAPPDPQVVATADQAAAPAPGEPGGQTTPHGIKPLPLGRGFLPIDTSDRGILALRGLAATHNPQPVSLSLPPGTRLNEPAPPPADFAAKMREGLDKYQALIARQTTTPTSTPAGLNQLH